MVEPSPVTGLPGTNLREDGFGVFCVWMKSHLRAIELSIKLFCALALPAKSWFAEDKMDEVSVK